MDGDEKGSCGTAVCDGPGDGAEDEAVASGDVAPAAADGEPTEPDSTEDVTPVDASAEPVSEPDESAPDDPMPDASVPELDETVSDDLAPDVSEPESGETVSDDPASDDLASDDPASDDPVSDDAVSDAAHPDGAPDEPDAVEPEAVTATTDADEAGTATDPAFVAPKRRLRPYLRRGVAALVAAAFVALGVGALAWISPSPEVADQRFVDAAQSEGHLVAPEQQSLVVSAARKICDRRMINETDRERRATALTSDEIAAVGTAFGADTRDFTTLALKTYCSS